MVRPRIGSLVPALAVMLWAPLAPSDEPDAFALGLAAYDGGGYGEAAEIWRGLAESGDAEAMVALAGLLRSGLGVAVDTGAAIDLCREADLRGNGDAQRILGDLHPRGAGVARDLIEAWAWLALAAEQGNA